MQEKMHFLCKCLIISTFYFWTFLNILGNILKKSPFRGERSYFAYAYTFIQGTCVCAPIRV